MGWGLKAAKDYVNTMEAGIAGAELQMVYGKVAVKGKTVHPGDAGWARLRRIRCIGNDEVPMMPHWIKRLKFFFTCSTGRYYKSAYDQVCCSQKSGFNDACRSSGKTAGAITKKYQ